MLRSKGAGFEMHLTKPVDVETLLASIEKLTHRDSDRRKKNPSASAG